MDEINGHATTYTGTQTRAAQSSEMLYHFLMNSVTMEFSTKLVLYQEEYTMNGALIGACLFKKVIQLTYMDTMATASHICETLMDMHLKLPTFQHDIGKFNDWICIEVGKLASRGQEANDLLTYLWKAYQVAADKKFVAYIKHLKDEHDEGRVTYMATRLMQLAQDKFEACEEKGIWGQLSEEQAKIVAMKAQLEKATPRQMKDGKPKKKAMGKESSDKGEKRDDIWKTIKPKPGEASTKQVKNKTYHWCKNHKEEGMWVIHRPEDCRNKPKQDEAQADKAEFPTQDELPSNYEDEEE